MTVRHFCALSCKPFLSALYFFLSSGFYPALPGLNPVNNRQDSPLTWVTFPFGRIFGKGEKTSTTNQLYEDYYGGWYDKNYPTK